MKYLGCHFDILNIRRFPAIPIFIEHFIERWKNKKKFQFQLNKFVAIVFVACEILCKKKSVKKGVEKRNRQRGDVCFMRHFMEAHNILHPFKVKRTEPRAH